MQSKLSLGIWSTMFLTFSITSTYAQKLTIEEAVLPAQFNLSPQRVEGLQWVKNADLFSVEEDSKLLVKDLKGKLKYSITAEDIANALGDASIKTIPSVNWLSENKFYFQKGDAWYSYSISDKKGFLIGKVLGEGENADFNVDCKCAAFTLKNNLAVGKNDEVKYVTRNEDEDIVSGKSIHRNEFGIAKGTFWSDDGSKLAFYQKNESKVSEYPIINYTELPALDVPIKYPMAGKGSETAQVGIFDVESTDVTYIESRKDLGPERYISNLAWSPDGSKIYIAEINRAQNRMQLNVHNGENGFFESTLFEEAHPKYVEPEQPVQFFPGDNSRFLWFSERDGYNQLYLYSADGKLLKQLTSGKFPITRIVGFSANNKEIIVEATGEDARQMHAYVLSVESGTMRKLTMEDGYHHISLSSSGKYFIDDFSSLDTPHRIRIFSMNGKPILELLDAPNPLENRKIGKTELVDIKAADGTTLHARIITPSNLDPSKKYPVVVYVYNGPHVQLVTNSWLGGAPLWMHSMCEEGYIIWTLDGRGSDMRGLEFEQAIFRDLGTLEIQDQMAGVAYLRSLPYVDQERMGVHGWSYGGFMTTGLMLREPGTFKAGVAGGPVIDWKYYEVMYTERYMDTPQENPEGYAKSDLKKYVKNLKGDLLMIHGSSDDVVVLQHNMTFLKQCIDEGVQVDFFVYPGHAHNVRGKDRVHLMTKVIGYFMDKL
jgi:dipeptidyl-peptidase-4